MYADYEFYKDVYKGNKIPETEYDALAERASDFLNYATRRKLENNLPTDAQNLIKVKKACCAVADALKDIELATTGTGMWGTGAVKSMSSGGESITYGNTALSIALETGEAGTNLYLLNKAKPYLSMVADDSGELYLYWGLE